MKDWLDQVAEERAADDPQFAVLNLRADFMLKLVPLRQELGLTQEEMGERLGITSPQIAAMETRPQQASLDLIAAYARALGARLELVLPAGLEANSEKEMTLKERLAAAGWPDRTDEALEHGMILMPEPVNEAQACARQQALQPGYVKLPKKLRRKA